MNPESRKLNEGLSSRGLEVINEEEMDQAAAEVERRPSLNLLSTSLKGIRNNEVSDRKIFQI